MSNKLTRNRKKNAVTRINEVFYKWYFYKTPNKDSGDKLNLLLKDLELVKPELTYLYNKGIKYDTLKYIKCSKKNLNKVTNKEVCIEPYLRDGKETYGIGTSEEIEENMSYISDRWRCSLKMRWILDVLEQHNK